MTVAHQAPLSMGFPRQEYWSRLPFPSPGDFPDLGIELGSPVLQADPLPLNHQGCLKDGHRFLSIPFSISLQFTTSVPCMKWRLSLSSLNLLTVWLVSARHKQRLEKHLCIKACSPETLRNHKKSRNNHRMMRDPVVVLSASQTLWAELPR